MIIWQVSFYDETGEFCFGTTAPRTYCPTRTIAKETAGRLKEMLQGLGFLTEKGRPAKPIIEKVELNGDDENCSPRGDLCNVLNRLDGYAFTPDFTNWETKVGVR